MDLSPSLAADAAALGLDATRARHRQASNRRSGRRPAEEIAALDRRIRELPGRSRGRAEPSPCRDP